MTHDRSELFIVTNCDNVYLSATMRRGTDLAREDATQPLQQVMRLSIATAAAVRSTIARLTSMARVEGPLSVAHTRSACSNIRHRPYCTKSMSVRHQSERPALPRCVRPSADWQLNTVPSANICVLPETTPHSGTSHSFTYLLCSPDYLLSRKTIRNEIILEL